MKTSSLVNPEVYNIPMLFAEETSPLVHLNPDAGTGAVQIIRVEKGLQARIWDCTFRKGFELHCKTHTEKEIPYFTIAIFLEMHGLQFAQAKEQSQTKEAWNAVFFSPTTTFIINVETNSRLLCLSISFSSKWFDDNVLDSDPSINACWQHLFGSEAIPSFMYMDTSDKKQVQELIDHQLQNTWSKLYIKSGVLQLISDSLNKLKENETLLQHNQHNGLLTEAESLLCTSIAGAMPTIKHLANKYALSEITIKRYFRQKHGVSMFTFFIGRKMVYAKHLILEKDMPVADAAHAVGYKNVHHFMSMYKKHNDADSDHCNAIKNIRNNYLADAQNAHDC
jgi:AraC-like DNA-binding protein